MPLLLSRLTRLDGHVSVCVQLLASVEEQDAPRPSVQSALLRLLRRRAVQLHALPEQVIC
jgi:hypothetical protein